MWWCDITRWIISYSLKCDLQYEFRRIFIIFRCCCCCFKKKGKPPVCKSNLKKNMRRTGTAMYFKAKPTGFHIYWSLQLYSIREALYFCCLCSSQNKKFRQRRRSHFSQCLPNANLYLQITNFIWETKNERTETHTYRTHQTRDTHTHTHMGIRTSASPFTSYIFALFCSF